MPKMPVDGRQIKVWLPAPIYTALAQEAENTGRPMAEIARETITGRYLPQMFNKGIAVIEQALLREAPHPVG